MFHHVPFKRIVTVLVVWLMRFRCRRRCQMAKVVITLSHPCFNLFSSAITITLLRISKHVTVKLIGASVFHLTLKAKRLHLSDMKPYTIFSGEIFSNEWSDCRYALSPSRTWDVKRLTNLYTRKNQRIKKKCLCLLQFKKNDGDAMKIKCLLIESRKWWPICLVSV